MAFKFSASEGFFQNWKDKRELKKMRLEPDQVKAIRDKIDSLTHNKMNELLELNSISNLPNMGYLWKYWFTIHFKLANVLGGPVTKALMTYKSLTGEEIKACGDAGAPVGDKVAKLEKTAATVRQTLEENALYKGAWEYVRLERKARTLKDASLTVDRIKKLLSLYLSVADTEYDKLFPNSTNIGELDHDDGVNWVLCHHLTFYLEGSAGYGDIDSEFPEFDKLYSSMFVLGRAFDEFQTDLNNGCCRIVQFVSRNT